MSLGEGEKEGERVGGDQWGGREWQPEGRAKNISESKRREASGRRRVRKRRGRQRGPFSLPKHSRLVCRVLAAHWTVQLRSQEPVWLQTHTFSLQILHATHTHTHSNTRRNPQQPDSAAQLMGKRAPLGSHGSLSVPPFSLIRFVLHCVLFCWCVKYFI